MGEQLKRLARRIPPRYVGSNGRNMDASDHTVITQLLLLYVGPYSFERVETLRTEIKGGKHGGVLGVTGVVCRLTCEVDGRSVSVEEAGGVENAGNQDGDGERLKHAMSDALKRCAMRLGLGLHIWAQDHYFLDKSLAGSEEQKAPATEQVRETPEDADGQRGQEAREDPGRKDDLPATRKQFNYLQGLVEDVVDEGVSKFEQMVGKPISELTRAEASEWIGRLSGRAS